MPRLTLPTFQVRPARAGFRGDRVYGLWHRHVIGGIVAIPTATVRADFVTRQDHTQPGDKPAGAKTESDGSLLALCVGGDLSAFAILVDRHHAMVRNFANRMLGGTSEAEDVAQEALLRLWRNAAKLDVTAAGAGPWLRRVVTNLCLDRLRVQGRLTPLDDDQPEAAEPPLQLTAITQRETSARVAAAMAALPDRQRVALALFHFEDLTLAGIASQLDLSVDAVESLLARARRTLKKQLEAEWRGLMEDVS